ncbi:MAG: glycosyl transferase family 36, partial [Proteobacteria bacterium]|nr:glycosyl transferase family 36 [Pseudomonadota bacterium]
IFSVMRIETSDPGFDRMVNDWLPYQVLAAHLWGRTGPSQRSGGYGYRDQLQDMLPFLYLHPEMARRQILLHAGQQFFAGDVMQWWHQSWEGRTGLGVRNRASDPHLWLAYLVYQYVEATGDLTILDEELTYLEGRRIPRDREGVMFTPRLSRDREPLYRHCVRAIDLTLQRLGANGLPLIGTGDWNDGLSLVGFRGRGESTWLGFFLYDILTHFANIVGLKEGEGKKTFYLDRAAELRKALAAMWRDGQRYVRAITDSGEEMVFGDALNASWPVISGAADFDRGACAVEQGLKDLEQENLVLLLSPAFTESSRPNPGKLADYPPGVRENGGQYSHGASWLVDALVKLSELSRSA